MTRHLEPAPVATLPAPATFGDAEPVSVVDRELSWLEFNGRVLQEASDPTVPLFERLSFLGIFASNLDEFFRVRVASLRSLLRLKKKKVKRLSLDPKELLAAIHDVVSAHQAWSRTLFRDELIPELRARGVVLTDEREIDGDLRARVADYFESEVLAHVDVFPIVEGEPAPALDNHAVYLAVELFPVAPLAVDRSKPDVALVRVPSPPVDRFALFPDEEAGTRVLFLDDVVRLHLADLFPDRRILGAWAVEVSRDSELYLDAEFAGDIVEAIRKSLSKRETGALTRFLYDPDTPVGVLRLLEEALRLEPHDLVEGDRYHNLGDLTRFPTCGVTDERSPDWPAVAHPVLSRSETVAAAVSDGDQLLHFPYHSFDHVVRFLTEAAEDPTVKSIRLTVYRVSNDSRVLRALIAAADRGKDVRVFVEAKARFDEKTNLEWAARLEERGILTFYSMPDLKVHAKVALVVRTENGLPVRQAYLGTGNFNEETARYYTDFGLLTADPALTGEIATLFRFLEGRETQPEFQHLIVAPFGIRDRLERLIEAERERARRGEPASIVLKLNGLEDDEMIDCLRAAAADGVEIRGIVRGICRWTPDEDRWGEQVQLRSIVDRYLEHGRAYVFGNGGDPVVYLGSADWMFRNLSRRVEVVFPVRDPVCRAQVLSILDIQLRDNQKARLITSDGAQWRVEPEGPPVRAQEASYEWLRQLAQGV